MHLEVDDIIRVYSGCIDLITIKRKLLSLNIVHDGSSSNYAQGNQLSYCSGKMGVMLIKMLGELYNQLGRFNSNNFPINMKVLNETITKLKSNKQLMKNEQKLQKQIRNNIKQWQECNDAQIYYDYDQRDKIKKNVQKKYRDYKQVMMGNKENKKPLFASKIQRQFRQNLEQIYQQELHFNKQNKDILLSLCRSMNVLLSKQFQSLQKIQLNSSTQYLKKQLLQAYIDTFHNTTKSIKQNQMGRYEIDLILTLKKIKKQLLLERNSCQNLFRYIEGVSGELERWKRGWVRNQERVVGEILQVREEISLVVGFREFREICEVVELCGKIAIILRKFNGVVGKNCEGLQQQITEIEIYIDKIQINRIERRKKFISNFLEDKKFLQNITKNYKMSEISMIQCFTEYSQEINRFVNQLQRKISKPFVPNQKINKIFDQIFLNGQIINEDQQRSFQVKSKENSSITNNNNDFLQAIQTFFKNFGIFSPEEKEICSFQCSLGPKLLIHGTMKLYNQGIYYQSYFNKKNLFFGKTNIFIEKKDILDIKKSVAFLIFADVIQVDTKRGPLHFHALGKREKMYQSLTNTYFPEHIQQEGCVQMFFNEFKGNSEQLKQQIQQYFQPLSAQLCTDIIKDCTLRSYFKHYLSQQQFTYKGKTYQNFKTFTLTLAEAINITSTKISPSIPYYFKYINQQLQKQKQISQGQSLNYSQMYLSYGKSVPMIPFVSKGGYGLCEEKVVYRWGGPCYLVVDIFSQLKGFSLTEGMQVRCRQVFKEQNASLSIVTTAQVNFQKHSATNNLLRSPALSNLKSVFTNMMQIIKTSQKHKPFHKKSNKNSQQNQNNLSSQDISKQLQILKLQNKKLKYRNKLIIILFFVIYLLTVYMLLFTQYN